MPRNKTLTGEEKKGTTKSYTVTRSAMPRKKPLTGKRGKGSVMPRTTIRSILLRKKALLSKNKKGSTKSLTVNQTSDSINKEADESYFGSTSNSVESIDQMSAHVIDVAAAHSDTETPIKKAFISSKQEDATLSSIFLHTTDTVSKQSLFEECVPITTCPIKEEHVIKHEYLAEFSNILNATDIPDDRSAASEGCIIPNSIDIHPVKKEHFTVNQENSTLNEELFPIAFNAMNSASEQDAYVSAIPVAHSMKEDPITIEQEDTTVSSSCLQECITIEGSDSEECIFVSPDNIHPVEKESSDNDQEDSALYFSVFNPINTTSEQSSYEERVSAIPDSFHTFKEEPATIEQRDTTVSSSCLHEDITSKQSDSAECNFGSLIDAHPVQEEHLNIVQEDVTLLCNALNTINDASIQNVSEKNISSLPTGTMTKQPIATEKEDMPVSSNCLHAEDITSKRSVSADRIFVDPIDIQSVHKEHISDNQEDILSSTLQATDTAWEQGITEEIASATYGLHLYTANESSNALAEGSENLESNSEFSLSKYTDDMMKQRLNINFILSEVKIALKWVAHHNPKKRDKMLFSGGYENEQVSSNIHSRALRIINEFDNDMLSEEIKSVTSASVQSTKCTEKKVSEECLTPIKPGGLSSIRSPNKCSELPRCSLPDFNQSINGQLYRANRDQLNAVSFGPSLGECRKSIENNQSDIPEEFDFREREENIETRTKKIKIDNLPCDICDVSIPHDAVNVEQNSMSHLFTLNAELLKKPNLNLQLNDVTNSTSSSMHSTECRNFRKTSVFTDSKKRKISSEEYSEVTSDEILDTANDEKHIISQDYQIPHAIDVPNTMPEVYVQCNSQISLDPNLEKRVTSPTVSVVLCQPTRTAYNTQVTSADYPKSLASFEATNTTSQTFATPSTSRAITQSSTLNMEYTNLTYEMPSTASTNPILQLHACDTNLTPSISYPLTQTSSTINVTSKNTNSTILTQTSRSSTSMTHSVQAPSFSEKAAEGISRVSCKAFPIKNGNQITRKNLEPVIEKSSENSGQHENTTAGQDVLKNAAVKPSSSGAWYIWNLVVKWKPFWLRDQMKTDTSPPIYGSRYSEVKDNYDSFDEYYNTYFPLFLLHVWHKIYNNWRESRFKAHFKAKIQVINYMIASIECTSVLSNTHFVDFPKQGEVVIITFLKSNGSEEQAFGYIHHMLEKQISPSPYEFRKKFTLLCQIDKNIVDSITVDQFIIIEKLYNLRIIQKQAFVLRALKKYSSLKSLPNSSMKRLMLKPKDCASKINVIKLPSNRDIMSMFTCIERIADYATSSGSNITLVEAPPTLDHIPVITKLVQNLVEKYATVLVCMKEITALTQLSNVLLGVPDCTVVLAVKSSEVETPDGLKQFTLHTLLRKDDDTNTYVSNVLKNCNCILTVLSNIFAENFIEANSKYPKSNLVCIIDDANLYPEDETLVPLSFNLKHLVMISDTTKKLSLHPSLQNYGYQKTFYDRLFTVKSVL